MRRCCSLALGVAGDRVRATRRGAAGSTARALPSPRSRSRRRSVAARRRDADVGLTLPLGLPWIGAHFRLDALAAFFLVVVNLGGATASLYGLGYGRHESAPQRVLPFFPAFLAAMNLVVLADDAFTFLVSWEFMSLASWALVMAHHREADNARAGYVYLVMASFGTLALLLAFGLLAGPDGAYAFAAMRAAPHPPARRRAWCWRWRCSAPARRRASCRCMSGCRSPIRRRRATSRR